MQKASVRIKQIEPSSEESSVDADGDQALPLAIIRHAGERTIAYSSTDGQSILLPDDSKEAAVLQMPMLLEHDRPPSPKPPPLPPRPKQNQSPMALRLSNSPAEVHKGSPALAATTAANVLASADPLVGSPSKAAPDGRVGSWSNVKIRFAALSRNHHGETIVPPPVPGDGHRDEEPSAPANTHSSGQRASHVPSQRHSATHRDRPSRGTRQRSASPAPRRRRVRIVSPARSRSDETDCSSMGPSRQQSSLAVQEEYLKRHRDSVALAHDRLKRHKHGSTVHPRSGQAHMPKTSKNPREDQSRTQARGDAHPNQLMSGGLSNILAVSLSNQRLPMNCSTSREIVPESRPTSAVQPSQIEVAGHPREDHECPICTIDRPRTYAKHH